jgi:hypothetical protein
MSAEKANRRGRTFSGPLIIKQQMNEASGADLMVGPARISVSLFDPVQNVVKSDPVRARLDIVLQASQQHLAHFRRDPFAD